MGEIQVISTSLVTPHTSEDLSISRIELTPWDVQLLLVEAIQKGLLFPKPSQSQLAKLQPVFSTHDIIHHLKISFTHTLSFFPLLAGRFSTIKNEDNTTSYFISCNNEGAEFTHAMANGVFIADILDTTTYIPQIIHSFFPLNGVLNYEGVYKPLFGVQVTELEDGIFIGCSMNHSLGDGTAFWHFINSWSEISRGFSSISKSPVFSRWFPDDFTKFSPVHIPLPEKPIQQKQKQKQKLNPTVIQEKLFHFTKESIAKLKYQANLENGTGTTTISSFQAVLAHIWRSVIRCSFLKNPNQEVFIKQPASARGRITQPCLADEYFGNAFVMAPMKTTAKNVLENGLGWAALEINKFVASMTSESMKKWYVDMMNEPKIVGLSRMVEDGSCLFLSSSARHSVYTADFGWGEALAVRSGRANKNFGKITVFPGREEGSIDFEFCFSLDKLVALQNDADFMDVFQN